MANVACHKQVLQLIENTVDKFCLTDRFIFDSFVLQLMHLIVQLNMK